MRWRLVASSRWNCSAMAAPKVPPPMTMTSKGFASGRRSARVFSMPFENLWGVHSGHLVARAPAAL